MVSPLPDNLRRPVRSKPRGFFLRLSAAAAGTFVGLAACLVLIGVAADLLHAASNLPAWRAVMIAFAAPLAALLGRFFHGILTDVSSSQALRHGTSPRRARQEQLARITLIVVTVGAGFTLGRIAYLPAENHPGAVYGLLIAPALLSSVAILGVVWLGARKQRNESAHLPWGALIPLAVVLAGGFLGANAGENERGGSGETLNMYCRYGAVSSAQLQGCLNHVTTDDVGGLHTDAARFARGTLQACLGDAGPFCANALYLSSNAGAGDQ